MDRRSVRRLFGRALLVCCAVCIDGFARLPDTIQEPICPCIRPLNSTREWIEIQFKNSDVVFEGELVSHADGLTSFGKERFFTYRVLHLYKGQKSDSIVVQHWVRSCDFDFVVGSKYLVYASNASQSYTANLCGRTNLLERAEADLRFLRGEPATAEDRVTGLDKSVAEAGFTPETTGIICGVVTETDGRPFQKATISVRSADGYEQPPFGFAFSDANGRYAAKLLKPGSYYVVAAARKSPDNSGVMYIGVFPNGSRVPDGQQVPVTAQRETCEINFRMTPLPAYVVKGRVEGQATGLPDEARVWIEPMPDNPSSFVDTKLMDEDGAFSFGTVPRGHYRVKVWARWAKDHLPKGKLYQAGESEIDVDSDRFLIVSVKRPAELQ